MADGFFGSTTRFDASVGGTARAWGGYTAAVPAVTTGGATARPPRLVITRARATPAVDDRAGVESPAEVPVTPTEREDFVDLVLADDDDAVRAFVDGVVRRGVGVGAVYLDLLAPTAEALGRMWEDDSCDFVDVTLASGRLQRAVRELGHAFVGAAPAAGAPGRVLLSAIPGEQHTLGLFMVAEFLLRDGWGVRVATPETGAELGAMLRDDWYDVVGFSAACDTRLLALRHEIASVRRHSRNAQVSVVVGGRIFVDHPDLVGRVGADGFAASAEDAPRCARALLGARSG